MRQALLVAPIVSLVACELPSEDYSPLLPDTRLLIEQNDAAGLARAAGEPSHYAEVLNDLTTQTNEGLGAVLELIGTVTELPPSHLDNGAELVVWGPWAVEGVFGQLTIQGQDDGSLEWALQFRPEDQEDWVDGLIGVIDAGSTEEASTGRFTIDFSVAQTFEEIDGITGAVSVDYDIAANGAVAEVSFTQVSAEGVMPRDGTLRYAHTRGEGGQLDTVLEENVDGTDTDAPETIQTRARWDGTGAGRTDAELSGGDLGSAPHSETECWGSARTVTYYANTFTLEVDGESALCAFATPEFFGD